MGVFNTRPRFQDRDMRQLPGDEITLSGDTNIVGNLRFKPGAVNGFVLTSLGNDGTFTWAAPSSGGTGVNIYNSDGLLTNDRVVSVGDAQTLLFEGLGNSKIIKLIDTGSEIQEFGVDPTSPVNGVYMSTFNTSTSGTTHVIVRNNGIEVDVNGTTLTINPNNVIVDGDLLTFSGVTYNNNYSDLFVDRSLVDKAYVDRLLNFYGQVSVITSGVINITTSGAYQSTGLVGTLNMENKGISLGTTDTLAIKNTSGFERLFKIYASADIDAGNNKRLGIKLTLNGVPIDETECNAPTGNGTSFAKLITNWMIRLQPNDEVALWVTNFTNTGNVTLERARIVANTII